MMYTQRFEVDGASIIANPRSVIAQGSMGFVNASFSFDNSWDGLLRIAIFASDDAQPVEVTLSDDACVIPVEVLNGTSLGVCVVGLHSNGVRATTGIVTLDVAASMTEGMEPQEPTLTVFEQIIAWFSNWSPLLRSDGDGTLFLSDDGEYYEVSGGGEGTNDHSKLTNRDKDIQHSATALAFSDGQTFQEKFDSGQLTGHQGEQGLPGTPGTDGEQGQKGETGDTGATGVAGAPGADGITPHIGSNGNWYLDQVDTGKPSRGQQGVPGVDGAPGEQGIPGTDGAPGEKGETGTTGSPGADGASVTVREAPAGQGQSISLAYPNDIIFVAV